MATKQDQCKLPEDGSVQKALAAMRSDESGPNAFVVLGYSDNITLTVVAEGKGGLEEVQAHFIDDVRYVVLRKDVKVELAKTVKFLFIDWTPATLKPMRKAAVGTHKRQVGKYLEPYHFDIQVSDLAELQSSYANSKFDSSVVPEVKAEPKPAAAAAAPSTSTPSRSSYVPKKDVDDKKNAALSQAGKTTINFVDEAAFKAALASIRKDSEPTDWILASYAAKDTLQLLGSGAGGLDELLEKLEPENINFGLVRITDILDGKSKTVKFVLVKWQPDSIKPMKKAEVSTRAAAISLVFAPVHVDLQCSKREELTKEILLDRVTSASGSKSHVVGKP